MMLSVILPCYNESEVLCEIYKTLIGYLSEFSRDYEIIFVNDGSTDDSLVKIKLLADKNKAVKYISFSRNFGKESAMYAGLESAVGDYVAVMDCDLQDPPSMLGQMLDIIKQGEYDCVATCRYTREGEPVMRSMFAKMFYKIMKTISKTEFVDGARDFRMMTRQMVDAVISVAEYNRFSKGIFSWVGFNTYWIAYENKQRSAGKSKWSFWQLVKYSFDALTDFSTVPLLVSSVGGFLFCGLSIAMMIYVVVKTLVFGDPVAGYPSLVSIILFLGGVQLLSVGIIGQYISRIYMETKRRPKYIKKESNIDD